MGLIVSTIDEAGVNELFVKAFHATPDQGFNVSRNGGNAQVQMQLSVSGRVRALDFASGVRPIDLRGSGLNPPVSYGNVKLRAEAELQATIHIAGWSRTVSVAANADVTLAGSARVVVERQTQAWLARLELDAANTSIGFGGNRDAFVAAVRKSLGDIDTNPALPGKQPLPQAVINAAADVAAQLFDAAAGPAGQAATEIVRALIGSSRVSLGHPVPRRYRVAVPGGGDVEVEITQLAVAITANQAALTATFA
jgi:hypothetical protein